MAAGDYRAVADTARASKAAKTVLEGQIAEPVQRRGPVPFGYRLVGKEIRMDPKRWRQARWLFEQALANQMVLPLTVRLLPADFPWRPSAPGFLNWICNPILRGGLGAGQLKVGEWERVEWGRAPRLITTEEYESAMQYLHSRRVANTKPRRGARAHLLTSVLVCANCSRAMGWIRPRRITHAPRYQCRNRSCLRYGSTVREALVREQLASVLAKRATKLAAVALADAPVEVPPEEALLREQLGQLEGLEAQGVKKLRKSILAIRDQIAALRMARIVDPWQQPDYAEIFSDERVFLTAPKAVLRPVLLRFVKRVEYRASSGAIQVVLR